VIIALIVVALLWPLAVVVPLALVGSWIALSLIVRAFILARQGENSEHSEDNPSE
jgi:ABC-type microcin C transport system permease subunit YejE